MTLTLALVTLALYLLGGVGCSALFAVGWRRCHGTPLPQSHIALLLFAYPPIILIVAVILTYRLLVWPAQYLSRADL